jgi:hypothetical protein
MWFVVVSLLGLLGAAISAPSEVSPQTLELQRLSNIVRHFQDRLDIPGAKVQIAIVETNERLASVRPSRKKSGTYLLEMDQAFLKSLSEAEQRAVLAHEVGHVWIFTHQSMKQSEALANEKALELVTKADLERVYEKVWRIEGERGLLQDYLSQKLRNTTENAAAIR